ncbi:protein-disulfide reductase DsbD domain-containing protein [Kaistia adipata]|uniref:protein-disulfide reductase DsbD domain-containing protein n=1 Tax=Kaistia adipata TaxID=166954 RepID=UPI0006849A48|nr:protein-disulfide reductase DsbD domain-containing protein [Kaistia adipata]
MSARPLIATAFLALTTLPAAATVGPWVGADKVHVRIVATPPRADGALHGAIEIALAPGWKTYWRNPGDAGVPPRFDFSASVNARDAVVDFPAPERVDDGYAASNVYRDRVILPLSLKVPEPDAPVRLDVVLDIGVCEAICIPVNLRARVEVSADAADQDGAPMIERARAALPGPGRPGEFELLSLKRVGGPDSKPEFEATFHAAEPAEAQLFVETPADWFADPPKPAAGTGGRLAFRFAVDRRTAAGGIDGAEIGLTLTEGRAATSRRFKLDGDGPTP